jgi:hypothetical protein
MHDDKAMQVLEEIRDLIQERIGSSIKPDAVEIKALSMEPDKGDDAMGMDDEDDLSPDDAKSLSSLWESEGVGDDMGGAAEDALDGGADDDEEMKRRNMMMGKG